MALDPSSSDFHLIWESYIDFEAFTRKADGDLNFFIGEWKKKMAKAQSAGCEYSDLLLGLKLIEKVNLSHDSIVSVISKLTLLNSSPESFLSQVVRNVTESSYRNGLTGNQNLEKTTNSRINSEDEEVSQIKNNLLSYPIMSILEENLPKPHLELHPDVDQGKGNTPKKGSRMKSVFLKCPICDKNFMLAENLETHIKNHDNAMQGSAGEDFSVESEWIDSTEIEGENESGKISYDVHLKKEIKNETSEVSDIRNGPVRISNHESEGKNCPKKLPYRNIPFVPCEVCGKSFAKNNLKNHMKTHTPTFKCSLCPKECEKSWMLKRHMECHKTTRDHNCTQCDKTFRRKDALSKHFIQMHTDKGKSTKKQTEGKIVAPKRKFPCEVCGRPIAEDSMNTHIKAHFSEVFKCNICPNKYSKLSSLEKHMETHKKSYECSICHKEFRYSDLLRIHMETHRATRDFICSYCGKKYKTKMTLRGHMKMHTKAKLPCKFCDKMFVFPASLKFHIRAHHTGEKPYKCDFCEKRYYTSTKKAEHERIHTGEKPLPCHVCGKYFRLYSTRRRHIRTIHKEVKSDDL